MLVKQPQANSVRNRLPQIGQLHTRSKDSSPDGLGWLLLDSYHISLNQLGPLDFFRLHVSKLEDNSPFERNCNNFVTGITTALRRSRAAKHCRR